MENHSGMDEFVFLYQNGLLIVPCLLAGLECPGQGDSYYRRHPVTGHNTAHGKESTTPRNHHKLGHSMSFPVKLQVITVFVYSRISVTTHLHISRTFSTIMFWKHVYDLSFCLGCRPFLSRAINAGSEIYIIIIHPPLQAWVLEKTEPYQHII